MTNTALDHVLFLAANKELRELDLWYNKKAPESILIPSKANQVVVWETEHVIICMYTYITAQLSQIRDYFSLVMNNWSDFFLS